MKLLYLAFFGLVGSFLPFLPLFLYERGMADWQLGWILSTLGISVIVTPLFTGHLADRHIGPRNLAASKLAGAAVALTGLYFSHSFLALFIWTFVFGAFVSPLFGLVDSLSLAVQEWQRKEGLPHSSFMSNRVWGSYGFIIPSLILFPLLRLPEATYVITVISGIVFAVLGALCVLRLPNIQAITSLEDQRLPGKAAAELMMQEPLRTFMGSRVLLSISMSMYYVFYPRLLQELGIAKEYIGLVAALGVVSEIILAPFLVPAVRALSIHGVSVIGGLSVVLRLVLLALFPNLTIAVASQALHGPITASLLFLTPPYLTGHAAPHFRHSIVALSILFTSGIARVVGSVLGGYIADVPLGSELFGLQTTMLVAALIGGAGLIWSMFGFRDTARNFGSVASTDKAEG